MPFVFASKNPHHRLPKLFVGVPVVRADGRSVGQSMYGHVIAKFSRMGSSPHFLTHGASLLMLSVTATCVSYCRGIAEGKFFGSAP